MGFMVSEELFQMNTGNVKVAIIIWNWDLLSHVYILVVGMTRMQSFNTNINVLQKIQRHASNNMPSCFKEKMTYLQSHGKL